jgi:hypothetical protein
MACVTEFARAVAPCGTTTVVADPHEIANVLGTAGIDYMLRSAEGQPMDCLFALPSCVPATDMETAGARLNAVDLAPFMDHPRIVALAEMMNYPGVIFTDADVMAKLALARHHRRTMDGHAPGTFRPPAVRLCGCRDRLGPRVHPGRGGAGKTGTGHAHHGARGHLRPQPGRPVSSHRCADTGAA